MTITQEIVETKIFWRILNNKGIYWDSAFLNFTWLWDGMKYS